MLRDIFIVLLGASLVSCGPGENNATNNTNNNASNNGTLPSQTNLVKRITIPSPDGEVVTATALNKDGSKIAIARRNASDLSYSVRLYASDTGNEIRELKGFESPPEHAKALFSINDLFWADNDRLSGVVSYLTPYTWDANSGELLSSRAIDLDPNPCAGPNGKTTFHPANNQLFTVAASEVGVRRTQTICRIDFDSGVQTPIVLSEGPAIESIVFNNNGDQLWVNFSDPTEMNGFSKDVQSTRSYTEADLALRSQTLETEKEVVAVSDDFFAVQSSPTSTSIIPGDTIMGEILTRSFSPQNDVMAMRVNGELRVIALPSGQLIGTLPTDNTYLRSFSSDGKTMAYVKDGAKDVDIFVLR